MLSVSVRPVWRCKCECETGPVLRCETRATVRVAPAPRRPAGQPAVKMTELLAVYLQLYRNTNQQPVLVDNPRPELVTRNADGSLDLSYECALGWVRKAFKGSDFKLSVGLTVGCKFPVNDDDEFQRQLKVQVYLKENGNDGNVTIFANEVPRMPAKPKVKVIAPAVDVRNAGEQLAAGLKKGTARPAAPVKKNKKQPKRKTSSVGRAEMLKRQAIDVFGYKKEHDGTVWKDTSEPLVTIVTKDGTLASEVDDLAEDAILKAQCGLCTRSYVVTAGSVRANIGQHMDKQHKDRFKHPSGKVKCVNAAMLALLGNAREARAAAPPALAQARPDETMQIITLIRDGSETVQMKTPQLDNSKQRFRDQFRTILNNAKVGDILCYTVDGEVVRKETKKGPTGLKRKSATPLQPKAVAGPKPTGAGASIVDSFF